MNMVNLLKKKFVCSFLTKSNVIKYLQLIGRVDDSNILLPGCDSWCKKNNTIRQGFRIRNIQFKVDLFLTETISDLAK